MTFPDTALDLRTELLINSAWTDISAYTEHDQVDISRGHPDESVTVAPGTYASTWTDNDGRFSTKNPVSPYYPYLVRNTPCRVSVPSQNPYLRLENDSVSYVSCPDSAGVSVTGDMEIQLDVKLTNWQPCVLASKWNTSSDKTWALYLNADGTLTFEYWDGTTDRANNSVIPLPYVSGRFAVKVTLKLNDGSGNHVVTFFTSTAIGGTWATLNTITSAGTITSLFDSTAVVSVGYSVGYIVTDPHAGYSGMNGNVHEFRLLNGIGGTVRADPVFASQTAGATSFADAQSNTWTLAGTSEISDRFYRGHVEVAELPQNQDESGHTVLTHAAGGGLLRRLSQRSNPLNSPMYRAWTRVAKSILAAYWPMEDGSSATRFGSASGGQAMYFGGGAEPNLAANSDFTCSAALPVINGSATSGSVAYSGSWTDNQVVLLLEIPQAGELNGSVIAAVSTTGNIAKLALSYLTGGALQLDGYNSSGTNLFSSGPVAFSANGKQLMVGIALTAAPGGGTITWHIDGFAPGATTGTGLSGTIGGSVGAVTHVNLNPSSTLGLLSTVLGHCAVLTQYQNLFTISTYVNPQGSTIGALTAWAGEPAGVRFARLCSEEGIPFRARGNLVSTPLMGTQTVQTIQQLLQECADADRGVWYELRQQLGWGYITRSALYNQTAAVTVDYSQDHLGMWVQDPAEDDKDTVNDVTVTQTSGGSSSRQIAAPGQPVTGGRLSTQAPPNGAGTYDQNYSVNLFTDDDLDSEASWILHAGTVDQPRFPGIVLDLTNRDLASLFYAILGLELGDRLVINNPPAWLGPDPVSQLAQQISEELWTKTLTVIVCGVPEQPYEVAAAGSAHVDTDGTTLNAGVSSGATSMSFATAGSFPLWSTSGGDYPCDVMIAGERVTVTAMSGGSSPQTATVTRSVNGVSKAQLSGAVVTVYPSPVAAL